MSQAIVLHHSPETDRQAEPALTHHPKGSCASLGNVAFTAIRLYKRICISFHTFTSTNVARWVIIFGGPLSLVCGHISWDCSELGALLLNEALQKRCVFRSKHKRKGEKIARFPIYSQVLIFSLNTQNRGCYQYHLQGSSNSCPAPCPALLGCRAAQSQGLSCVTGS